MEFVPSLVAVFTQFDQEPSETVFSNRKINLFGGLDKIILKVLEYDTFGSGGYKGVITMSKQLAY